MKDPVYEQACKVHSRPHCLAGHHLVTTLNPTQNLKYLVTSHAATAWLPEWYALHGLLDCTV